MNVKSASGAHNYGWNRLFSSAIFDKDANAEAELRGNGAIQTRYDDDSKICNVRDIVNINLAATKCICCLRTTEKNGFMCHGLIWGFNQCQKVMANGRCIKPIGVTKPVNHLGKKLPWIPTGVPGPYKICEEHR